MDPTAPSTPVQPEFFISKPPLPKKGLIIIIGSIILLAIILLSLYYFKIIKFKTTPAPTSSLTQIQVTPEPKVSFACPVPKELCATGKEIFNGSVFLGVGYILPKETKIIASMPGSAFFTATEDKVHSITTHTKVVQTGADLQKGYVLIYEFFTPQASGSAETKNITQGQELGTIGFGTFPKNPPYDGINLILSMLKDGKPFDFKALDLLPI